MESSVKYGVISLIINSILNLILIPILGITGAAIAKGISLITLSVILVLYVKNILGINTSIFRLSNRMLSK